MPYGECAQADLGGPRDQRPAGALAVIQAGTHTVSALTPVLHGCALVRRSPSDWPVSPTASLSRGKAAAMLESDLHPQRDRFTALMDTWQSLSDDRKRIIADMRARATRSKRLLHVSNPVQDWLVRWSGVRDQLWRSRDFREPSI